MTGTLQDRNGTEQLTITREMPGKLRIDFAGLSPKALVFDGNQTSKTGGGALSDDEKDIMESFYYDTADAFFSGRGRRAGRQAAAFGWSRGVEAFFGRLTTLDCGSTVQSSWR